MKSGDAVHTPTHTPTAVIGAGLSGLYLARLLSSAGLDFVLIEAQDRLGGRILTEQLSAPEMSIASAFDLGPTWFWPAMQPRMQALLEQLGLSTFEQPGHGATLVEMSPGQVQRVRYGSAEGSMRVQGGMGRLIEALAKDVDTSRIHTGQALKSMRQLSSGVVELQTEDRNGIRRDWTCASVVSTLPPRLLAHHVRMDPELPASVVNSWRKVPTWMAPHAKFLAIYEQPFWRQAGLSGQAQSRVGPLAEIHDASAPDGLAALFGFVGVPALTRQQVGPKQLQAAALAQLQRLFGDQAAKPLHMAYKDWSLEPYVATQADLQASSSHPAYGQQVIPAEPWNHLLVMAGSETAAEQGGYLEGALVSAEVAFARLKVLAGH